MEASWCALWSKHDLGGIRGNVPSYYSLKLGAHFHEDQHDRPYQEKQLKSIERIKFLADAANPGY